MALPSTGIITAEMINQELGRAANAPFSLNDAAVRALAGKASGVISFADLRGKSSEIVKVITASQGSNWGVSMRSLFTYAEWSSDTDKRIIINAGVELGSTLATGRAMWVQNEAQSDSWGGKLTLENRGTLSGAGGARNSGSGGAALFVNVSGKSGQLLQLINTGIIRGGGGGGGRGGAGGPGQYGTSVREPASGHAWQKSVYEYTSREIRATPDKNNPNPPRTGWRYWIVWGGTYLMNGTIINDPVFRPSMVFNGITYTTEAEWKQGQDSGVIRTYTAMTQTVGGAGGQGGLGQGYGQARGEGTAGAAGGTNAGHGNWGNWGGEWGQAGLRGLDGTAGNVGAGAAGQNGGAAGYSILGNNRVSRSGSGSLLGPTANS